MRIGDYFVCEKPNFVIRKFVLGSVLVLCEMQVIRELVNN